jgi:hypothetical protein
VKALKKNSVFSLNGTEKTHRPETVIATLVASSVLALSSPALPAGAMVRVSPLPVIAIRAAATPEGIAAATASAAVAARRCLH